MTNPPDWLMAKNIQSVFKLLKKNGGQGRIVGGAVRDHLLGVAIGDIDFCSTHTPQQLIEIAQQNNVRYIETGVKYGTVTLIINHQPFEVTSLREDVETNGRHAKVVYGTSFEKDAMRRDFTFNALYMDANGQAFDPLGTGIRDLADRKVKFIGNAKQRIEEDYLRILRYFRFIARFGFEYDQEDYAQIPQLVTGLTQLSAERLLVEFKRIYESKFLIEALGLMCDCKIFEQLFKTKAVLNKLEYLQNTTLTNKNIWLIRFRLSVPHVDSQIIVKRLKPSRKDQKILNQLNQLNHILSLNDVQLAREIYRHGHDMIADNLIHFAAETNFNFEFLQQKLSFVKGFEIPTFPIKGADLFDLGFEAGPQMGQKIKQLESMWLESGFKLSKQDLLTAI
ncbi:MAG: CCA tRNA nucleotidyltransferase [OCS116 cluster bacterium]|nr:CCA tRNA nucleotidyltransferase [OCS116 cluster bacterium]